MEMYNTVCGVEAYDDMYGTESPQPYPYAIPLPFIYFMQNLIIPGVLENYVLHIVFQLIGVCWKCMDNGGD